MLFTKANRYCLRKTLSKIILISDKQNIRLSMILLVLLKVKTRALTRKIRKLELRRCQMIKILIYCKMMIPRLLLTTSSFKMMKCRPALTTKFYSMKAETLYRSLRFLTHSKTNSRILLILKTTATINSSSLTIKTNIKIITIPCNQVNLAKISISKKLSLQLKLLLMIFFQ